MNKDKSVKKDEYLTSKKYFTLECNKCKNRDTILMSINEEDGEIVTHCNKCSNTFTIELKALKSAREETAREIFEKLTDEEYMVHYGNTIQERMNTNNYIRDVFKIFKFIKTGGK